MKRSNNNYLVSAILMLIGAICFGFATYANFHTNNTSQFFLFMAATICDIIACILNFVKYKKTTKIN